jgi:hypothetical protein
MADVVPGPADPSGLTALSVIGFASPLIYLGLLAIAAIKLA